MFDDLQALGSVIGGAGVLALAALALILRYRDRRSGNGTSKYVPEALFEETIKTSRFQANERHTETMAALGKIESGMKTQDDRLFDHVSKHPGPTE